MGLSPKEFEMPAYLVRYDMVDAYSRPVSKEFETVTTIADEAAAEAAAIALGADLAALTEADILSYTIKRRVVYTDSVTAGANRDEGITLSIRKTDNYIGVLKVPAPVDSVIDPDGSVDIADAIVVNFAANFLTGGDFTFSDGEQGSSLLYGSLDK